MREVFLDNDWEFEFDAKRKATTTGELEAAASLTSVTMHFAATKGGTALGSTTTTLTERSAKAGRYYGILDQATLDTALTSYVNRTVYEVIIVDGDAKTSEPVLVRATRRPG